MTAPSDSYYDGDNFAAAPVERRLWGALPAAFVRAERPLRAENSSDS